MNPLFETKDFLLPPDVAHVCAGGETATLRSHIEAFDRYLRDKSAGASGREIQERVVLEARASVAAAWRVATECIGLVGNVAEGISMVMESIDWSSGDNVCVLAGEYPSVVMPFWFRGDEGVELRVSDGRTAVDLVKSVDYHTRIVAVSYVSYLSGERLDLNVLRRAADEVGAMLIVDFTQAAGYLPINAAAADFAFSACYKWMLGVTGTAVAFWNRERQPEWTPSSAGWYSLASGRRPEYTSGAGLKADANRFTRGNPSHASVYALSDAVSYLAAFDVHEVQRHVQGLTTELIRGLEDTGIRPSTPADPRLHGASVCIDTPFADQSVAELREHGVYAWGGRGRIRFSFHGYNSTADVDRILDVLPRIHRHPAANTTEHR